MAGRVPQSDGPERTLSLLEPAVRGTGTIRGGGYLDLVETPPASTGLTQDLMVTRLVPQIYERWWRPTLGRAAKGPFGPDMAGEQRIAEQLLELQPGDGVLDVACGTGNFTRGFARTVGPAGLAVGIDLSESMLARAVDDTRRARLEDRTAYIRGDASEPPFRPRSFDAVCCFAALHLFADPERALDRMTALLTGGGRIALFTSARSGLYGLRPVETFAQAASGMRMFGRERIASALKERGYENVTRRISGFTQFVGGRLPG